MSVTHDGPVTVVTITRPERRNAVDSLCAEQLRQAFVDFERDESQSVAILTGAEGTFCAGADLKALAEGDRRPDPRHGPGADGTDPPHALQAGDRRRGGIRRGGGIELALWCDLRVAAEDAIFGVFCRRFGVPLCDLGTVRLPRIIGHGRAMDLILTGGPWTAPRPCRWAWSTGSCHPAPRSRPRSELARQLAALPQFCLRSDRMSVLEQWGMTEEEAAVNEARRGRAVIDSGETLEGALRFAGGAGRGGASLTR